MASDQHSSPVILMVEPDDQARSALLHNLRSWGYRVIVSLNEKDAIERLREGGLQVDLILINQVGASIDQVLADGRSMLYHGGERLTETFIVVMAERYGEELEGQDVQVGDREYVTYLEDAQQLRDLLYRLCPI
jgi:CheY-like chemotaxis protein